VSTLREFAVRQTRELAQLPQLHRERSLGVGARIDRDLWTRHRSLSWCHGGIYGMAFQRSSGDVRALPPGQPAQDLLAEHGSSRDSAKRGGDPIVVPTNTTAKTIAMSMMTRTEVGGKHMFSGTRRTGHH
jgi:hypothetical protein